MADDQSARVPLSDADQHLTNVTARSMRWAVANRDADVAALVTAAIAEHGWDAVHALLMGWPVLMQHEVYPHTMDHPELIRTFVPQDQATGETCGVDDLPPNVAWAGRWIQAIITRDEDNAAALWDILSEDEDIGPYLDAVLNATAGLIRLHEEGKPTRPGGP